MIDPVTHRCSCCGAYMPGAAACERCAPGQCDGEHKASPAPLLIAFHQAVVSAKAARAGYRR